MRACEKSRILIITNASVALANKEEEEGERGKERKKKKKKRKEEKCATLKYKVRLYRMFLE